MSKWAALARSNTAIVVSAAALAVAVVGAAFYINSRGGVEPGAVHEGSQAATPPQIKAESDAMEEVATTDTTQTRPSIDEVRVEADGLTIVAGRASPGSKVSILLDGVENTIVTTDASGGFAAITMIEPKTSAQILTLVQRAGTTVLSSLDEIILAPSSKTRTVAQALPGIGGDSAARPEAAEATVAIQQPEDVAALAPEIEIAAEPDIVEAAPDTHAEPTVGTDRPMARADTETATPGADASQGTQDGDLAAAVPTLTGAGDDPAQSAQALEATEGAGDPEAPSQSAEVADDPPRADVPEAAQIASVLPEAPATQQTRQLTVLKSTVDGVEVLAPRLSASDNIAIDTISYSDAGEVELSGRAKSDARLVRVYVNNRPITELDVDAQGRWRGALPGVETGVYTLRVDEVNAAGTVMSRVETPFKREDPQVLVGADADATKARQITVQTGTTLWAIARDRYGEGLLYVQVFEANSDKIVDPDLIYPGQVFSLPD